MRRFTLALTLSGCLLASADARATGMQGHIYMAECALEQGTDPRLTAILDEHLLRLQNGAFFPDSGYAGPDHDQGEVAHWEQFVEAYIQQLRARHSPPYDSPEALADIAFLLGLAAHGITDSTFDPLLYERVAQIDPGNPDSVDLAMDIFLVAYLPRDDIPDLDYDAGLISDAFQAVPHDVTPEEVDDAMPLGRAGIAAVTLALHNDADNQRLAYPFAAERFLDPRTPGGYPYGASVALGYYRQLLQRINGDTSADGMLIGVYPSEDVPLVTLDHTRPDGRIQLMFGVGLDRDTINQDAIVVHDEQGEVVPADVSPFRGDQWVNAILVTPTQDWQPATRYTIRLRSSLTTLYGTTPSDDIVVTFNSCDACEPYAGEAPPSPCPDTDVRYLPAGEEPEEEPDALPPTGEEPGCSCRLVAERRGGAPHFGLALALMAATLRRRRASP